MIHAAEIDRPDVEWLNTDKPLGLEELRGRLVLLDFWTFCCVNCLHVIPVLHELKRKFKDQIVIIGVHSPKFTHERDISQVVDAIKRYDIRHPVIHDPDRRLWGEYVVKAWPTLVLISADGYVIGSYPGEPQGATLEALIARAIGDGGTKLQRSTVVSEAETSDDQHASTFRYPAKIKPVPTAPVMWAMTDTGHHQVVLLDCDGAEIRRFGSGAPGFQDGPSESATFAGPEGLVCVATSIYVADTRNHAIRCIDLETGRISTLAGTGHRGTPLNDYWSDGNHTDLASPWDIELVGDRLYFANAGTHQLGEFRLSKGDLRLAAGSGREGIHDGSAPKSQLAQPSGLAYDAESQLLYFVDSETSSVRSFDLQRNWVETVVGKGLFVFGDVDGSVDDARLQHPLGIAVCNRKIFVADTYNNTIKIIDPEKNSVRRLDEGNYVCRDSLCIPISEPAGLSCISDQCLLVVDTNNHRVVKYDLHNHVSVTWGPPAETLVQNEDIS